MARKAFESPRSQLTSNGTYARNQMPVDVGAGSLGVVQKDVCMQDKPSRQVLPIEAPLGRESASSQPAKAHSSKHRLHRTGELLKELLNLHDHDTLEVESVPRPLLQSGTGDLLEDLLQEMAQPDWARMET